MSLEIRVTCDKCGDESKWSVRISQDICDSKVKEAPRYLQFYDTIDGQHICFGCSYNFMNPEFQKES